MAYALVGTIGAASQGAAVNTAVTPAYGQTSTAGNLLICFVAVTGGTTKPTTPSGWTIAVQTGTVTACSSTIYYKIGAGSDAAPTIAALTSGVISAQLAEFSGNTATPLDQTASVSGTTSPQTATCPAPEAASGELILMVGADFRSAARTPVDTLTSNHATITQAGNNNGVSSVNHYSFGYSTTNSNSGNSNVTVTASVTTSLTALTVVVATFLIAPALPLPELIFQPITPSGKWRYR